MTSSRKPKMAITLGDPAGVGPETVIQAMASPLIHDVCDPFVIGHLDSLEAAAPPIRRGQMLFMSGL